MEPRPSEQSVESRGEGPTSPPRPPERKRRFRIVKLEERIAPKVGGDGSDRSCGHNVTCRTCTICCVS
jgi:hypothetical protein